jgi:hypothetical protein
MPSSYHPRRGNRSISNVRDTLIIRVAGLGRVYENTSPAMRDRVRVRRVFWTARCGICVPASNCRRTIFNLSARSIERSPPISAA